MAHRESSQIPAKVMEHLQGINFPASRSKLIENAKREPGPDTDQVLEVLASLTKEEYSSPAELMHEIGRRID